MDGVILITVTDGVILIMATDGDTLITDGAILITGMGGVATILIMDMDTTTITPTIQAEEDLPMLMEQMEDIPKAITGIHKVTTELLITTPEIVQQIVIPEIAHHLLIEIILNRKMALQTAIIHPVEQETIQVLKVIEIQAQAVVQETITIQAHRDLTAAQVQAATIAAQEEDLIVVVHLTAEVAEDRLAVVEEDNFT